MWNAVTRMSALFLLILAGCFGWPKPPEIWHHPTKDSLEQADDLRACENLAAIEHAQSSSTVNDQDFRMSRVTLCMISKGYVLD